MHTDMAEAPNGKAQNLSDTSSSYNFQNEKRKALQFIEEVTTKADEVQRGILTEILTRSANIEYLQRHGLGNCHTDGETFKKRIPVNRYEDLLPDIQRIANGDNSPILCSQPISEFLTSSGTSGGERKLIPLVNEELERRAFFYTLILPVMSQFVPGLEKGKAMCFLFTKSEATTPGGLPARPALTSYYKSKYFTDRPFDPYTNYTSPNETILCTDPDQSMYSQMLCGLCQHMEVVRVGAIFASGFVRAMKFLETHWKLLCSDIRSGSINPRITDPEVRKAVSRILKPDPGLADFIEGECRKEVWKGIVTRLWPNAKYVEAVSTGSMVQYVASVDYYSNELPLVSILYASSECYYALNLNPLNKPNDVAYTIIPNMGYFEFLPANRDGDVDGQDLVDLVDVKLGQEYEPVLTNYSGLYRYRVGDILRVVGFKNKTPQFSFVCRKNVALSIDSDKTNEIELQEAMNNAVKHLIAHKAFLQEFTGYADTSTIPGHYVIFWEIKGDGDINQIPTTVFEDCCLTIEESLNSVYRQCRTSDKSIGPLEIRVVQNGTFDKLMDYAISNGASPSQYKTPRCVKYAPIVELLNSRVICRFFSQKCPTWVPGHKQWDR